MRLRKTRQEDRGGRGGEERRKNKRGRRERQHGLTEELKWE